MRGATINAVGSSIPELFTTLFSLMLLGEVDNFAFGIGTTAGKRHFQWDDYPSCGHTSGIGLRNRAKSERIQKGDFTRRDWSYYRRAYFDLHGFGQSPHLGARPCFDVDLCGLCWLYVRYHEEERGGYSFS